MYLVLYGSQWGTQGTDSNGDLTASGDTDGEAPYLAPGLSISPAGLISGTLTAVGSFTATVTATDTTGAAGSADFTWTVTSPNPGIVNGGFETGNFTGWVTGGPATSIVSSGQHSGNYAAQAGSPNRSDGTSTIAQTFTAGPGDSGIAFWYDVNCQGNPSTDGAAATLTDNTTGSTSTVLGQSCPLVDLGWTQANAPVIPGHSYTLTLTSTDTRDDPYFPTDTLFDDVSGY